MYEFVWLTHANFRLTMATTVPQHNDPEIFG